MTTMALVWTAARMSVVVSASIAEVFVLRHISLLVIGPETALGILVVVTFFNHNFVNCKATCTLIWRLKIYEIKYNISLNDVHT